MKRMTRRSWAALAVCALVLALRVGIEWDSGGERSTASARRARLTRAYEPLVLTQDVPTVEREAAAVEREAAAVTRDADEEAEQAGQDARDTSSQGQGFEQPEPEEREDETARVANASAETDASSEVGRGNQADETAARRRHDGDLSRALLKTGHLRDRTREALGGGHLRDINSPRDPGPPLGEATLATAHLRDQTRQGETRPGKGWAVAIFATSATASPATSERGV